jgi:hypothetical protein
LTEQQIKLLKLDLVTDSETKEGEAVKTLKPTYINYKLNLSNQFKTFVITYEKSENELSTVIVTYGNDYFINNYEQIAYDEIAESLVRIESEITKDNIIVSEKNYSGEAEEVTKTNFKIDANGIIRKVK